MTKQDILEATLDLACQHGLGRDSMQMIADKVNLKKSSLYSHFKSKDEIIESMYTYFREQAKTETSRSQIDLGKFVEGKSLENILTDVVASYRNMNASTNLFKFYQMIMAERSVNPMAAQVMVEETEKMLGATKMLFYAISAKGITRFEDPDGAALVFTMGVHSIMDFEFDAKSAGLKSADGTMKAYIKEFCRTYS